MKKIIYSIMIIILLTGCAKKNNNIVKNNIDIDTADKEIYENVNIKLDKFYFQEDYTTINLIITNDNDYTVNIGNYKVLVYDKENNLIGEFNPNLEENINPHSSTNQMFSIQDDLKGATKIEYEFTNITKIQ